MANSDGCSYEDWIDGMDEADWIDEEQEECCRHCGKPLYEWGDLGCGYCDRRSPDWGIMP